MARPGIEPRTSDLQVRCPTDCATRPGRCVGRGQGAEVGVKGSSEQWVQDSNSSELPWLQKYCISSYIRQSFSFQNNPKNLDLSYKMHLDLKSKTCMVAKFHGSTLKCLSIGTPNTINFPIVSNGKLMVFKCPNIQAHYNEGVIYLNFGTPKNNEFSIWNKWKIYYF